MADLSVVDTAVLVEHVLHQKTMIETLSGTISANQEEISTLHSELDSVTHDKVRFESKATALRKEVLKLKARLGNKTGRSWFSALREWLRNLASAQKYEVKNAGDWKAIRKADGIDNFFGNCQTFELKFTDSGDTMVLCRAPSPESDEDATFRLQYRGEGEENFATIATGTAPATMLGEQQFEDSTGDALYAAPIESPDAMSALVMPNVNVQSKRNSLSSEICDSDVLSVADAMRNWPSADKGVEPMSELSDDEESIWSTSSECTSRSSLMPAVSTAAVVARARARFSARSKGHHTKSKTTTKTNIPRPTVRTFDTRPARYPKAAAPARATTHDTKPTRATMRFVSPEEYAEGSLYTTAPSREGSPVAATPLPSGLSEQWLQSDLRDVSSPPAQSFVAKKRPSLHQSSPDSGMDSDDTKSPRRPDKSFKPMKTALPFCKRNPIPAWRRALQKERAARKAKRESRKHPILDQRALASTR
mmetsp:Transcript_4169/g.10557  ORF Transcript_4169/g.10557 Transcript_4169/m.10557 type:complete len:478 (-) Transcript_4169:166-1599(-)